VPELPEVETMRRLVECHLVGRTIVTQVLTLEKLMRDSPLPTLEPIVGQAVVSARRRAKVLVVDLTGGVSLMLHFKLAGQLAIFLPNGERAVAGHPVPKPAGAYPHKATHWTLTFDDGTIAYYSDIRQFGWIRLLPTEEVMAALDEFSFGPEAVGPDGISIDDLIGRLQRRSIPVKQALLDQSVLAGLGNIYVDEALHAAKIHPARPAKSDLMGLGTGDRTGRREDHPLPRVPDRWLPGGSRARRRTVRDVRHVDRQDEGRGPRHLLLPNLPTCPRGALDNVPHLRIAESL
jgi:formamidopyrimidine-DNA glycosylase